MRHRELLRSAATVIGLLLSIASLTAQEVRRPNILWIIAEDMSPDLGCYGNKAAITPNIDALAAKGMMFNNVFTTGPACSPSRTALATGVYQTTLGAHHMRYGEKLKPALPEPIKILPELMRDNGYYTGNINGIGGTGTAKDDWLFKTSQKSWDTRSWDKLIEHQPFYAQINSASSHRGFNSTKNVSKENMQIPPYYPDHAVSRRDWAGYLNEVSGFDRQVGAILKRLQADNLDKNTIVYVFSDHGRPMPRGKNWLYDSGTRIPLVIYYPEKLDKPDRYQAGKENSELLSSVDLVAATVLMAGAKIPDWMQGRSFLQKDSEPRQYIHTAVDRIGNIDSCSRAVRSDTFKYIRNFKTPGSINECATPYRQAKHPIHHLLNIMGEKNLLLPVQAQLLKPLAAEELYDLKNDPYETVNLIGNKDFDAIHKELKTQMTEWIGSSKDKGLETDSDAIVEHFRKYGVSTLKQRAKSIRAMRSSVEKHFK